MLSYIVSSALNATPGRLSLVGVLRVAVIEHITKHCTLDY